MSSIVNVPETDAIYEVPDIGTPTADLKEKADEILGSYSERDRLYIFDASHRDNFLSTLAYYGDKLTAPSNAQIFVSQVPEPIEIPTEDTTPTSTEAIKAEPESACAGDLESLEKRRGRKPLRRNTSGTLSNSSVVTEVPSVDGTGLNITEGHDESVETLIYNHDKNEQNVLYSDGKAYLLKKLVSGPEETSTDDSFKINVLFDGEQRVSCRFRAEGFEQSEGSDKKPLSGADNKWADLHLLGSHKPVDSSELSVPESIKLCLECTTNYPSDKEVDLPDRTLISRSDDDAVLRVLRTDQEAYRRFLKSAKSRVTNLLETGINEKIRVSEAERIQWAETEKRYLRQVCKI